MVWGEGGREGGRGWGKGDEGGGSKQISPLLIAAVESKHGSPPSREPDISTKNIILCHSHYGSLN